MRTFPFGIAPVLLLILALLSGVYLAAHPPGRKTATLTFWTFSPPVFFETQQKRVRIFERNHPGVHVDMQRLAYNALHQRLLAAFQADQNVPDMALVEISMAGTFFRGPIEQVGFWPLNDVLEREGWKEKIVPARFAPYTRQGKIFGLPLDIHPVMLAYRRDVFEKENVDVSQIETWEDFIQVGRRLTQPGKRYMIELADSGSSFLEVMLFQRGGGIFDQQGNVVFDNEIGQKTLAWYVPLVAKNSPRRIAGSLSSSFSQSMTQALEEGYFLTVVVPDWRARMLENDVGGLSGKMGLMPFPAVEKGGRPTSTWGGTMFGITKKCENKELAWELARYLYLDEAELAKQFGDSHSLPPLKAAWDDPAFDQPIAYYGGQRTGRAFAHLAPLVPPQYTSPFVNLGKSKLSEALIQSVQYYERNGENGFDNFVRQTLKEKAEQVRRQIRRNPF